MSEAEKYLKEQTEPHEIIFDPSRVPPRHEASLARHAAACTAARRVELLLE